MIAGLELLAPRSGALKKRTTRITVETQRVVVMSISALSETASCRICGAPAKWVTPDDAAAIVGVTPRTIYRWVEDKRLHFVETPAGLLLICVASLSQGGANMDLISESLTGP